MNITHAVVKVRHDRPTIASFAVFGLWSFFVYGFGAALSLLRDDQGSADWIAGLHGTSLAVGGVIGALVAPGISQRLGRGWTIRLGSLGAAAFIALFLLPGASVWVTLAAIFIATFFGNLLVAGVNAFVSVHQGAASPAAYTENTGLAALMGLLAPLSVGFAAATVLGWRFGLLIGALLMVVFEVIRGRSLRVYGAPGDVVTKAQGGAIPTLTYWALFAGMFYIGAEFCISFWGVNLLRERADMSAAAAAAGLATITGGLFIGRLFGSQLTKRFSSEVLLRSSLVAGLIAFGIAWWGSSATVMLPALFLTGLCLSLSWPLNLDRMIRSAHGRSDTAAALALAFTTAAIGLAPFALGGLAGVMDVHTAFLIVPILIILALILTVMRPVPELNPALSPQDSQG